MSEKEGGGSRPVNRARNRKAAERGQEGLAFPASTGGFFNPEKQNYQTEKNKTAGNYEGLAESQVLGDKTAESRADDPADKPGAVVDAHRPAPVRRRCKVGHHRRRRRAKRSPGGSFNGLDREGQANVTHQGVSQKNHKESEHRRENHRFPAVTVGKVTEKRAAESTGKGPGGVDQPDLAGGCTEVGEVKGQDRVDHSRTDHHRQDGKTKGIKALMQKLLTPLRLFYHKRRTGGEAVRDTSAKAKQSSGAACRPRIVVDTNVLMGGLINPAKASGRVIGLWLDGRVDVLLSPDLRAEYLHIFNKMRFGSKEAVSHRERAMEKLLRQENLVLVEPGLRLRVVKEDPSDNRLIECAVSGRADYIVSQDRHLLRITEYGGIKVLTAQAFLFREYPESSKRGDLTDKDEG